jgi:hypothetical protein
LITEPKSFQKLAQLPIESLLAHQDTSACEHKRQEENDKRSLVVKAINTKKDERNQLSLRTLIDSLNFFLLFLLRFGKMLSMVMSAPFAIFRTFSAFERDKALVL